MILKMVKPTRFCQCSIGGVMKIVNTRITNNKGFSLLEVLVGVSIIGIISAIAVPTYQSYTRTAALTSANSTLKNLAKAFNTCSVLSDFSNCDGMDGSNSDLSEIKISCSECTAQSTTGNFCVEYEQAVAGKNFKGCVSVVPGEPPVFTYGGDFKFCHQTVKSGQTGSEIWGEECSSNNDCPTGSGEAYEATTIHNAGTCNAKNGTCAAGVCS